MVIPREGYNIMIMRIEKRSYLAGLIDGDGCITAQIVRRNDYRWKYQINVSVTLYQKTSRH